LRLASKKSPAGRDGGAGVSRVGARGGIFGLADLPQAPAMTRTRWPAARPACLAISARHSALSAPQAWPWQAIPASNRPTFFASISVAGADEAAVTPNEANATPKGGAIAIAVKAAAATRKNRIIG